MKCNAVRTESFLFTWDKRTGWWLNQPTQREATEEECELLYLYQSDIQNQDGRADYWKGSYDETVKQLLAAQQDSQFFRRTFRGLVNSDAFAVTYETIGDYRAGLLKSIDALSAGEAQ